MAQGLGPNVERDMPVCCLVACCVLEWARHARQFGRDTRQWQPSCRGRSWALPAPEHLRRAASPLVRAQRHHCLSKGGSMDDAGAKVVDLIFGRWRSQILYTGVKLGVFDALASGPKNAVRV